MRQARLGLVPSWPSPRWRWDFAIGSTKARAEQGRANGSPHVAVPGFLRRTWSSITIIHHSDGKFRVWAATGANERNGIPFATLDEANDHAKQLQAKAGGHAEIVVDSTPIAISQAAFDAITSNLPLGSFGFEREANAKGERQIWLNPAVIDRLRSLRGPGESFSDVILGLAAEPR
jgi:hypothetical protein